MSVSWIFNFMHVRMTKIESSQNSFLETARFAHLITCTVLQYAVLYFAPNKCMHTVER